MIMFTQKNYNGMDYIEREAKKKFRDPKNISDAKIVEEQIVDDAGNVVKTIKKKAGNKILSKKVIIPASLALAAGSGIVAYKHHKDKAKEKAYSQEEEIANIPADPGTEEYSHLRAEIEKKPSQQAAAINEQYEVQERGIKKSAMESKLAGENKELVNVNAKRERENNLTSRDASFDALNQILGGIE